MLTLREASRAKVLGEPNKKGVRRKVGSVGYVLFHPEDQRVVGFLVERSDLALMIKRSDRYVALDRVEYVDGELAVSGKAAWDGSAARRLGIDWDKTVAWAGMPVRAESGKLLGMVGDFVFEMPSGELNALRLSEGTTRDAAIGTRDIPASIVRGFNADAVVVGDEATLVEVDGGAAAAAGKAAAVVKVKTDQVADVATQKFDDVAVATGEVAGKAVAYARVQAKAAAQTETGKKAMGWLKALKDEVVDAMGDPDDDK